MIVISRNILPYIRYFRGYFNSKPNLLSRGRNDYRDAAAERAQLIAHAKREEQERIARDLHDQVGQDIACLTMAVHLLKPHVASSEGAAKLTDVLQLTNGLAQDLHRLIVDVRRSEIGPGALVPMLHTMTREWTDRSGIAVALTVEGMEGWRSPEIDTALFRVCQEALTNVVKHAAAATHVEIALHCTKKEIILSISDDGPGFRAQGSESDGVVSNRSRYGIVGMRERLAMVGGTITIMSTQPNGARIVAKAPLQEG